MLGRDQTGDQARSDSRSSEAGRTAGEIEAGDCRIPRHRLPWISAIFAPQEDSPSGLWRTLGKRVGCKPSGVRIPHPPPQSTYTDPSHKVTRGRLLRGWPGFCCLFP